MSHCAAGVVTIGAGVVGSLMGALSGVIVATEVDL